MSIILLAIFCVPIFLEGFLFTPPSIFGPIGTLSHFPFPFIYSFPLPARAIPSGVAITKTHWMACLPFFRPAFLPLFRGFGFLRRTQGGRPRANGNYIREERWEGKGVRIVEGKAKACTASTDTILGICPSKLLCANANVGHFLPINFLWYTTTKFRNAFSPNSGFSPLPTFPLFPLMTLLAILLLLPLPAMAFSMDGIDGNACQPPTTVN